MALAPKHSLFHLFLVLQWHLVMNCALSSPTFLVAAQSTDLTHVTEEEDGLADFGQTVRILGQMARTDQDFKDGLALDLFSPRNRTFIVQKNTSPLPGNFVSGSSGEPFVALSDYSWVIKVNDTAHDLIAKVELPYDPETVERKGCNVANTYVGVLSKDRRSWVIDESRRNVHISENKTRIIKMTSLDGEYVLLGRQTLDTANVFVQYGFGATRTVNLTGGNGVQQAEFVDGLRLAVELEAEMRVNVDLKYGINPRTLPTGMRSLYSFAWSINSSMPTQPLKAASLRLPVNTSLLPRSDNRTFANLIIAKRDLNSSASTRFEPVDSRHQKLNFWPQCQVELLNLKQLDGDYVILEDEKDKMKAGEEFVRGLSSNSTNSSLGATLRKDVGWMWTFLSMSIYLTLVFSI